MTYENIITDLKQHNYSAIYFLMGDEPYYIDKISNFIAGNVLTGSEKGFNQTILYGKDIDTAAVINAAKRYPMMSEYQVIIVKEAQNLKDIENLVYYASNPLKSTILVVNYKYKKLDKRKKLYKEIEKSGIIFESNRLYDDKIPDWISRNLKERGYSIQPTAAMMLTEFLGNELGKIVMELDKLIITLPDDQKMITPVHIEENIGISKDFNTIELQKALVKKDHLKAYRIADYFEHNQKNYPFNLVISSLYYFFNKVFLASLIKENNRQLIAEKLRVHPFFVSDYQHAARVFPPAKSIQIIHYLRQYDLKSKGVGNLSASAGDLLKELIYKIMN